MNYLDELNKPQREAVEATHGPLMIVAGAGAGKTKTLTHRIIHLIHKGVAPHEILAITFTNKAAKEMRERVITLTEESQTLDSRELPFVSTFHALGVHILRRHGKHLGVPQHFTILDKTDALAAIKESLKHGGYDPKQHEPRKVQNMISRQKNNMVTVEEYREGSGASYFGSVVLHVWEHYERILKERKALDFDDLLTKTAELLANNNEVRHHYQNVWKFIHIDEYQDTNKVQYDIATLLAQQNQNICVVGDTDQNIYSWRGADIQNMLNFEKDYPDATVILLEQNYRSTQTILGAANDIIVKNAQRLEKKLFTENHEGDEIHVYDAFDQNDEARFVAEESQSLINDGVEPKDIAVLYRANFQSRALEEAFLRANVPYQVLGVKFFERKEVKDVLSYLSSALNPDSLYDVKRIINVPTRGIGKVTLAKIFSGQENELPAKMKKKVKNFWELLRKIKAHSETNSTSELIKFIVEESGLEKTLKEGSEDDQERLENLRELVTLATKYDQFTPEEGIEKILADAALATDQDSLEKEENAVKLMTVHASKGLEFPYVFITGLEQDLFPHMRMGESKQTEESNEEERRLFYVALTRAEKRVYLSYASIRTIYGSQQMNIPSEFIGDIDESFLKPVRGEGHLYGDDGGEKTVYLDF